MTTDQSAILSLFGIAVGVYCLLFPWLVLKRMDRLIKLQEQQARDMAVMRDLLWTQHHPEETAEA